MSQLTKQDKLIEAARAIIQKLEESHRVDSKILNKFENQMIAVHHFLNDLKESGPTETSEKIEAFQKSLEDKK